MSGKNLKGTKMTPRRNKLIHAGKRLIEAEAIENSAGRE